MLLLALADRRVQLKHERDFAKRSKNINFCDRLVTDGEVGGLAAQREGVGQQTRRVLADGDQPLGFRNLGDGVATLEVQAVQGGNLRLQRLGGLLGKLARVRQPETNPRDLLWKKQFALCRLLCSPIVERPNLHVP